LSFFYIGHPGTIYWSYRAGRHTRTDPRGIGYAFHPSTICRSYPDEIGIAAGQADPHPSAIFRTHPDEIGIAFHWAGGAGCEMRAAFSSREILFGRPARIKTASLREIY